MTVSVAKKRGTVKVNASGLNSVARRQQAAEELRGQRLDVGGS